MLAVFIGVFLLFLVFVFRKELFCGLYRLVGYSFSLRLLRWFRSLKLLNFTLQNCYHYISDEALFGKMEYWQLPEQFYKNRKGDCEDYALYAREITKAFCKHSDILAVFNKKYGHAVNYFERQKGKGHSVVLLVG